MSYDGGLLHPWFDTRPVRTACRRMAREGGSRLVGETKKRTPVHLGVLRDSWEQKTLVETETLDGRAYESGVETSVDYAPAQEHGSGLEGPHHAKYPIVPKTPGGTLAFRGRDGRMVYTKRVMHPGVRGHHMVAISAALVEHLLDEVTLPAMREWAATTERQNRAKFHFGRY